MAITLTPALLQSFFTQLDMSFDKGHQARQIYWDKFAMLSPSSSEGKIYSWLAELPRMRKWIGPKQVDNIVARAYQLINDDWEETFSIDRNKLEDDEWGVYTDMAKRQGDAAASWPDDIVTAALINGTTAQGYDGTAFFSASHPVDLTNSALGTYSNLNSSTPLTQANYAAGKAKMRSIKGESGKPLGILPTVLMVPPTLEQTALEITKAQNITRVVQNVAGVENVAAAAPTNVYQGDVTVIVNERLIDDTANAWYLFSTNRISPLVFQLRKGITRVQVVDPQNPQVFNLKQYTYGIESRGTAGYSLPFTAQKNTP
jgi:phage major head subunit gpT-like protein